MPMKFTMTGNSVMTMMVGMVVVIAIIIVPTALVHTLNPVATVLDMVLVGTMLHFGEDVVIVQPILYILTKIVNLVVRHTRIAMAVIGIHQVGNVQAVQKSVLLIVIGAKVHMPSTVAVTVAVNRANIAALQIGQMNIDA